MDSIEGWSGLCAALRAIPATSACGGPTATAEELTGEVECSEVEGCFPGAESLSIRASSVEFGSFAVMTEIDGASRCEGPRTIVAELIGVAQQGLFWGTMSSSSRASTIDPDSFKAMTEIPRGRPARWVVGVTGAGLDCLTVMFSAAVCDTGAIEAG